MDAGLTEALVVAGDRSPSRVTVRSGALRRYAPEVEAAVYFCCIEALQNAAKHAPGAAVTVDLDEADGEVHFTVDDDGPGPGDATVSAGHGLANMTDRVGALGGSLSLERAPSGGTRVSGQVPVDVPEAG
jgi:signal transduction histidine kinase